MGEDRPDALPGEQPGGGQDADYLRPPGVSWLVRPARRRAGLPPATAHGVSAGAGRVRPTGRQRRAVRSDAGRAHAADPPAATAAGRRAHRPILRPDDARGGCRGLRGATRQPDLAHPAQGAVAVVEAGCGARPVAGPGFALLAGASGDLHVRRLAAAFPRRRYGAYRRGGHRTGAGEDEGAARRWSRPVRAQRACC